LETADSFFPEDAMFSLIALSLLILLGIAVILAMSAWTGKARAGSPGEEERPGATYVCHDCGEHDCECHREDTDTDTDPR
jgi:hypothetical protein